MRQSHLIVYNTATNYGRVLVQALVGFLLVPYIIRNIGQDSYGVVLLALSSLTIVELFALGIGKAVTKYLAEQKACGNFQFVDILFNSAVPGFFLLGGIGFAICLFLGIQFKTLFSSTPPYLLRDAEISMYIIAGSVWPCIFLELFKGVLFAEQRYDIVNTIGVIRAVVRAFFIVAYFNLYTPNLIAVVTIYSLSHLLERIGYFISTYMYSIMPRISFSLVNMHSMRMLMGFGGMVLVATVANILAYEIIKFIIARELSLADLTKYGIIVLLISIANQFVHGFANVLVPVTSKYQGLQNYVVINKMFFHSTKYSLIIILGALGITMPFLPSLLQFWVGPEFVDLADIGFPMFLSQIVVSSSICSNQMLSGFGKVKFIGIVSIIWATAGLAVTWFYLHYFHGANLFGSVLCMSIARTIGALAILSHGIKVFAINWQYLVLHAILKPVIASIIVIFTCFWILQFLNVGSLPVLVLLILASEFVFCWLLFLWCLDDDEKNRAKELIQSFSSK